MKLDSLQHYRCPECQSGHFSLESATSQQSGWVEEGVVICEAGTHRYQITRGIPRFVEASNYADSFGFQWNIHARTQLDSHTGFSITRDRLFEVTGWDKRLKGQRILEAGSGAGRFTEILLDTGADLTSFDYSTAVDANWKNNGDKQNLTLFQGNIFKVPLAPQSFDKVICFGVLQHTPDPAAAFASLARYVRPGGTLAVDIYRRDILALLHWRFVLRPITKRMPKQTLLNLIEKITPPLIPVARGLRKIAGRAGARLTPISEYSHLGLPAELNRQWAILDTFDMYSPAHDHPKSVADVQGWFEQTGFKTINVRRGPQGVVGTGVSSGTAS